MKTPHIDRLASDGVRYTNSFCAFPVCTPSRYSLLSGRYVHEHAGWDNRSTLAPQIATFPRIFRAAGYRTKAVGKMHFTPTYLDVGFDELLLAEQDGPGRWDDDYHRYLMRLGLVDRNDLEDQLAEYRRDARRRSTGSSWARSSPICRKRIIRPPGSPIARSRRSRRGRPAGRHLLMVGFIKPHHPFDPPAPWHTMYDPQKLTILPGWTEKTLRARSQAQSRLLPARGTDRVEPPPARWPITTPPFRRSTITWDDCWPCSRRRDFTTTRSSCSRRITASILGYPPHAAQGQPHVRSFGQGAARWSSGPVSEAPARSPQRLVSNVDLAPTLCRAAGLQPAAEMRGEDLGGESAGREIVFCESGRNRAMARTQTHKLIFSGAPATATCSSTCRRTRSSWTTSTARRRPPPKCSV